MRTEQPDKRTRLIETATKLAYGRGFRETSLADIAEAARVPVGNVYYYFKTKEEVAEAVVERRLEEFRAARAEWDRLSSPKERLLAFVGSVQANREQLARGGCPLGGACTGVDRGGGSIAEKYAALFHEAMPLRAEDALLAGCARSCTGRAALSRRNPQRSSMSPCVGLRSSFGPLGMKRIHESSRSTSSRPFKVWRLLRSAPTTARWWSWRQRDLKTGSGPCDTESSSNHEDR